MFICVCARVQVPLKAKRGGQVPLKQELVAVVSSLVRVLGIELRSLARAEPALNHGALSRGALPSLSHQADHRPDT